MFRLFLTAPFLFLTILAAHAARSPDPNWRPSDACRQRLMRAAHLQQLYAAGDDMDLRVHAVPQAIEELTVARAHGLHDANARQWLDINVNVGSSQFAIIVSLRRRVEDTGYGLPGEVTVWGLGGGGYHKGNVERVLARIAQHVDEFIALYTEAQRECTL